MTRRIYRAADHASMPWRNGAGTTREVARWRLPGSDIDFAWRLSFATVEQSGEFSTFPSIDRVIVLTEGSDLRLRIDGNDAMPLARFVPFAFAGEAEVYGESSGRSVDFNVMTHRDYATAEVTCETLTTEPRRFAVASPATGFLVVLEGTLAASAGSGRRFELAAYDVAELNADPLEVGGSATVALVRIR